MFSQLYFTAYNRSILFDNLYLCLDFCSGFNDTNMKISIMAAVTLYGKCMWPSFRSRVSRTQWHRAIGDSYRSTGPVMSSVSEQAGLSDIVYSSLPPSALLPSLHVAALGVQSTKGFCPMFNHSSPSRDTKHWGDTEREEGWGVEWRKMWRKTEAQDRCNLGKRM